MGKSTSAGTKGVTLVEILVVMALFLIVMLVTTSILSACMSVYRENDQTTPLFRRAAEGFDTMSQELRQCTKIYSPDEKKFGAGFSPQADVYSPFVFVNWCPEEKENEVVGYRYDNASHTVERIVYDGRYDVEKSETQIIRERRPIIRSAGSLSFRYFSHLYDEFIQCNVVVIKENKNIMRAKKDVTFPFQTKVKLQGGYR